MLSVNDAIAAILDGASPLSAEPVALPDVPGRTAAENIPARMTQPPFPASAMDGYAVRFCDVRPRAALTVVGEAPAGAPFDGTVGAGEAVRIFTGAVVPEGADHIVIQEDVRRDHDRIVIEEAQDKPRHIRAAGVDFSQGDLLAKAGDIFNNACGSIFAAANIDRVSCVKRPHVAIFTNGDELKEPGGALQPGEIINSNHYALTAMIGSWGAKPAYLGCAPDDEDAIARMFTDAAGADIIVPVGGASVGDYDYVKSAFRKLGGDICFEKVAVRPGKPTWFGALGNARVVGLPGNPASAIVTAALFIRPLALRLGGRIDDQLTHKAIAETPLPENGRRETYLRGVISRGAGPLPCVSAFDNQDSSLLSPFATCNALIRRLPGAPACEKGEEVDVVPFS